jgi:hypothetical protein
MQLTLLFVCGWSGVSCMGASVDYFLESYNAPYEEQSLSRRILFIDHVFFAYCAVNLVSGKKQVMLISEEQEMAKGRDADPQIIRGFDMYPDSALQRYINQQGP